MVADKHRPARSIRRAKVGAVFSGVAVIIGTWLTLSGRNITNAEVVEQLAGLGLLPLIINAFHRSLVRLAPFARDLFISLDEIALPAVTRRSAYTAPQSP